MIENMQRSKILNIIKNLFALFSFIFTAFLLYAVTYETVITHELPSDQNQVQQDISDKYSFLPKVFGDGGVSDDEENDNEKEKYDKGWYDN